MRDVLLTIHILAAAGFVGGGVYSLSSFPGSIREYGLRRAMERDEAVGRVFFSVAVGVLLLSGIALVLDSDVYGWGDAFVWVGIGVIVLDGIFEGAYLQRKGRQLAEMDEPPAPAVRSLLWQSGVVTAVFAVVAVYSMVSKLGN